MYQSVQSLFLLIFFVFFSDKSIFCQTHSISLGYGAGYAIANHPRFPKTNNPSQYISLSWQSSPGASRFWSLLNKKTDFSVNASFQRFGNDKTLGFAVSLIPSLGFRIIRYKKIELNLVLGAGLAYLNKKFDSFYNPENIAIGTHLNASVFAKLKFEYQHFKLKPFINLSVIHYSNGNAMSPNLGINIPFVEAGIRFNYLQKTSDDSLKTKKLAQLPEFKRRWSAFIQIGQGISATATGGPFFPVSVISSGVNWHYQRSKSVSAALEYSFNSAVYQNYLHNGSALYSRKDFDRYAFWLAHEWIFGHFGLFTMGGFYLNKHVEQKSIIATEVGINFYPKLPYKYKKNQIWLGVHVRAYTGLAEFVMLQIGYKY
jgi:hypothetical protein